MNQKKSRERYKNLSEGEKRKKNDNIVLNDIKIS